MGRAGCKHPAMGWEYDHVTFTNNLFWLGRSRKKYTTMATTTSQELSIMGRGSCLYTALETTFYAANRENTGKFPCYHKR